MWSNVSVLTQILIHSRMDQILMQPTTIGDFQSSGAHNFGQLVSQRMSTRLPAKCRAICIYICLYIHTIFWCFSMVWSVRYQPPMSTCHLHFLPKKGTAVGGNLKETFMAGSHRHCMCQVQTLCLLNNISASSRSNCTNWFPMFTNKNGWTPRRCIPGALGAFHAVAPTARERQGSQHNSYILYITYCILYIIFYIL